MVSGERRETAALRDSGPGLSWRAGSCEIAFIPVRVWIWLIRGLDIYFLFVWVACRRVVALVRRVESG